MILNTEFSCQLSAQSKVLLMNYKPPKTESYNVNPDKILKYCGTNDNSIISSLLHIVTLINMHVNKYAQDKTCYFNILSSYNQYVNILQYTFLKYGNAHTNLRQHAFRMSQLTRNK